MEEPVAVRWTLAWRWIAYGLIRARGADERTPGDHSLAGAAGSYQVCATHSWSDLARTLREGFSQAGILTAYLQSQLTCRWVLST